MEYVRWIVAVVALFNFGGLVADAIVPGTAAQHIRNPAWPPHAKFHNAQTMLMGIGQGALSLLVLFGARPLTTTALVLAAALAANYFLAMVLAPLFPGTAWCDPQFEPVHGGVLGRRPQRSVSWIMCGLAVVAVAAALLGR